VAAVSGAELNGVVKSAGLPVPGATVTLVNGDKKLITTTDDQGAYAFPEVPDGIWTLSVEMLGFTRVSREIGVAIGAPEAEWDLKLLPPGAAPAGAVAKPAASPDPNAPQRNSPARIANGGPAGNSARPAAAQAQQQEGRGGFQRLDVNASGNAAAVTAESVGDLNNTELNQSASESLLVNGSVSRGLDMPAANDWFAGRGALMGQPGGIGIMGQGMGGPGGESQVAGIPGAPNAGGVVAAAGGGPGGGAGGGGFGGGRGGFGGRPMMMGGRGGPGGRGPMNRPGVAAFGNARRDRRMQYNGNASFSLDNSVWDARSYSLTGQNTGKPAYAKARASVMFGGPLRIPKLLSGRSGFFNINYQMGRTRSGTTQSALVPTELERNGDFSQSAGQFGSVKVFDPSTGQPFPGNVIPASRINPAALGLLKYYPLPSFAAGAGSKYNYQVPIVSTTNQDNLNLRLNQTLNTRNRLSGGFSYQRSNSTTPNLFRFIDTGTGTGYNASIAWSHNFTTRVISNLNYRFSRSNNQSLPYFANRENVAAELGIAGTSQSPLYWGPPSLTFTNGFVSLADGNATLSRNQTHQVGESLLWIRGSHNITLGADVRRQQFNPISQQNARGTFGFTGAATNSTSSSTSGFDFADFLLGLPDTSSIAYGNADKYFRSTWYDGYINDDWRLSARFSINAGLRWDYGSPMTERYGRLVNLDFTPGFTGIAQVLPGQTGPLSGYRYPDSLVNGDRNSFSPRVGIAWRPLAKGSMVVRAGYGVYYNTSVYNGIANNMAQQPPLSVAWKVSASAANPLTLSNGFPTGPLTTITNTFGIDPNYRIGYVHTWTIAIQQNLPKALFLNVSYLGNKGTRLDQQFLPNSVAPGYSGTIPYPAGYTYETSNGNSTYHAAQVQLNRRFRSGFSGNLMYIYSKSIDDAATGGGAVVAQNWQNLSGERAVSSFNRTHVLNLSSQYSTGMGRAGGTLVNGWKGALLKDWTISTGISISSGAPLTAVAGGVRSVTGGTGVIGSVRANATGLPLDAAAPGEPFNLAAFSIPAAGEFGNAARNTITGPGAFTLNASASRIIRLGDRRSADLQFQAQNALNHVSFSGWNTTVGTTQYGALTGAGAMRSLTAILRFRF
jgi:hypothetical protein